MSMVTLNIKQTNDADLMFKIYLDDMIGHIGPWQATPEKQTVTGKLSSGHAATAKIWKEVENTEGFWSVSREIEIVIPDGHVNYWQCLRYEFDEDEAISVEDQKTMFAYICAFDQSLSYEGGTQYFIALVGGELRDGKLELIDELLEDRQIDETDAMLARIAA